MKNSLVNERLTKLQAQLQHLWVIEDYYDLYYLTHLKLSKGTLVVGKKIVLFVDGKYEEIAKNTFPFEVLSLDQMTAWIQQESIKEIYVDPSKISYERYLFFAQHVRCVAGNNPVHALRMIKSPEEIEALKSSTQLLMKGFAYIKTLLKEGVQEKKLAQAFEIFCLEQGADGMAFEPIIAFGPHSAMPHYRAAEGRLKPGDCVLIDMGVTMKDYASDMTRTLFFKEMPRKMQHLYKSVQETYAHVASHVRAGVSSKVLDQMTRELMSRYSNGSILHSVGHGLGLEVHEPPSLSIYAKQEIFLEEHMVITLEPGLYLPGVGGVRHENLLLVEKEGAKNFYEHLEEEEVVG